MYRATDLQNGLIDLIGWRQHYNTQEFRISNSLTRSDTGRYFQDIHPLLTLDNLRAVAPDFKRLSYPEWSDSIQYMKGDLVSHSGVQYRAEADNINTIPGTNSDIWDYFDLFSDWLETKTKGSISKVISSLWDNKVAGKTAKNILESKALFNGSGKITNREPNRHSLVGFEIVPIRANGITLKIDKIGLQFTGHTEIKLYLMHSSQRTPVKEIKLQRIRNCSMEWFTVEDLYLPYIGQDNDAGGSWYLVYDQTALQGESAIYQDKDWSAKPCFGCNREEVSSYNMWSQYVEFHPFRIHDFSKGDFNDDFNDDFFTPGMYLWDVTKNIYTYNTNYGLNLQITLECDITDIILEQSRSFQNIIGLQVGADMLREMAYNANANINRNQQNFAFNKQEILYELDGDSRGHKKSGLVYQLDQAMKAVSVDLTNLSKVCFPCNNRGVRYRTV